jgi:hypothetical protein
MVVEKSRLHSLTRYLICPIDTEPELLSQAYIYLWLASPACTLRLKSFDLFRGTLSDFHSLALKCLAMNTIWPQ